MARRDYASKPKTSKAASKPAATRRPAPPQAKQTARPVGLFFAALVATTLLGGGIYYLSSEMKLGNTPELLPEPSPAEINPRVETEPSDSVRAPGDSLPLDDVALQQDERFGFYDLLKQTEVETPEESAYTSTPKTAALDTPYILQAGSFRQQRDAEAMRARLTLAGLPNVRASQSGDWFRVTTGPFNTYNELKSATSKLEKLNIHPVKRKAN